MARSESFEEFYTGTVGRLLGQLFVVTGDLHEAEEIVQEAFTRAAARWARLRDYDVPEAWVRRVAMNLAADRVRSLRRHSRAMRRLGPAGEVLPVSVEALALAGALGALPVRQRQVLVLHYLVDLPVGEVARTLDLPDGTVKSLLSRGRQALAAKLGEAEEVPVMSDLRERFQELADAGARHGRTPGPQAALRRARQRRLRLVGVTAILLVVAVVAVTVSADRRAGLAPLAPSGTTTASTVPPDVSILPDPGEVLRPAGSPPGQVGEQMVRDVATEVAGCLNGKLEEQTVLVAWGAAHRRTWLIAANPRPPGNGRLCWADGLFEASGAGGFSNNGALPLGSLRASGSSDIRDGDQYWGFVTGSVTRRATRVRVLFDLGIPPLDIEPIQSGDQFPVNFYAGWYRMPTRDKRPATWQVVRVVAYDATGRQVAECRVGGPAGDC